MLNAEDTVSLSFNDCFDITECVPLEETDDSHVSDIRRIEFFEGNYYLFSSNSNIGLLVFDKNGKFVRRIGMKGNGHGEYTTIFDFAIDKKNRRLLLLCNRSSLIKIFSLDGIFIKEKVLHKTALNNLACINGLIVCTTNHQGFTPNEIDSLFYIFDEKLNFIKKHTYISENNLGVSTIIPSNIRVYGNKFVYTDFHEHSTYLLNAQGEIERCYKYEKDNLMLLEEMKNFTVFTANQFKHDFIFDSAILKDKCITLYKEGKRMKLSLNGLNGECFTNKPVDTLIPDFIGYDGEQIISVISLEDLNLFNNVPYHNNNNVYYCIIKYKLK